MSEQHPHVVLARKCFDSIVSRDFAALKEIFAEDAVMWQNVRGVEVLFAANISAIEQLLAPLQAFSYTGITCEATETGFVEQHLATGINRLGEAFSIPVCVVGTVVNGRITRTAEYVDGRAGGVLRS